MNAAIQLAMTVGGLAVPVDPVVIANLTEFELRFQLRELDLTDEQIQVCEQAVELVRQGVYPRSAA